MNRLIKVKAVFEIFLIITAIFFIANSLSAAAAPDSPPPQAEAKSCCEKTKTGESCVYTNAKNCDAKFKTSSQECSQNYFCDVGCCFNIDGTCSNAASESTCNAKKGIFNSDTDCSSVALCGKGCCVIAGNYFMATKQQCVERSNALFPNLKPEFNPEIIDESSCITQIQNKEKGCCIQGIECIYTERENCLGDSISSNDESLAPPAPTGNAVLGASGDNQQAPTADSPPPQAEASESIFESGKYCSKIPICGCKPKSYKSCYDGDVYWFDSCNNREDKSKDCDFAENTLCNSKTLKCETLNCRSTINKKAINGDDIVSYDGIPRKNGESWCEYDGAVGFGQDLVGSKHYRDLCINGEEFIEPCKDYREEYCLQANADLKSGIISEAACKPNRWKDCAAACNTAKTKTSKGQIKLAMQKDRECCEDPKRSCFWSGASESQIKKINADMTADLTSTCAALNSTDPACSPQNYQLANPEDGICLPLVPPGLKFWPDENDEESSSDTQQSTADAKKVCEAGTQQCTTYFYKNALTGWDWKSANTRCLNKDFAINSSSYCRSLGDCGTHYNIAGKFSALAYNCATNDGSCKGVKHKEKYDLLNIDWEKELGGFDSYTKSKGLQAYMDISSFESNQGNLEMMGQINMYVAAAASAIITLLVVATSLTATGFGAIAGALVAIITLVIKLLTIIGADTDKLVVTVSCLPWQAPYGSEDCEKCENPEILKQLNYNTCSEYKCMSLGQNCKWVSENEGSNRSSCLAVNVNDVNSPRISPWPEILTERFSISEFTNGYEITPAMEGYSLITFGIKTNEPSICKYSSSPGIKYDAMTADFGEAFIENMHMITLTAIPSKLNELYIKCKDAAGNANNIDYEIKFNARAGQDLTPPIIIRASIKNNAVITSDQTPIELTINEPSICRYSNNDVAYEKMANNMLCNSLSTVSQRSKFMCNALLNVNENSNLYNFRCKDLKGNTNQESYALILNGSPDLNITSTSPSGELDKNNITIEAATEAGSDNGIAACFYTLNNNKQKFQNTDASVHSSDLPQLSIGSYNIPISCSDNAGNEANANIIFKITRDNTPPNLMFVYKQDASLTITTDEASLCEYSANNFNFGSGLRMDGSEKDHTLTIEKTKYNIICQDYHGNTGKPITVYP